MAHPASPIYSGYPPYGDGPPLVLAQPVYIEGVYQRRASFRLAHRPTHRAMSDTIGMVMARATMMATAPATAPTAGPTTPTAGKRLHRWRSAKPRLPLLTLLAITRDPL